MPIVDPDPAGIGTYLVSAVLLALGIAIFLYILIEPSNSALFVLHQLFVEGR
jgi:hypothetical protein